MRRRAILPVLAAALALAPSCSIGASAGEREIPFEQAQKIALLVARHDDIAVDDRSVILNSMDTRSDAGFIPGYYSFSVIKESDSPGEADETIRMYVISKRTGETWELNLCSRYNFPALDKMQRAAMLETGATQADDPHMRREIGCADRVQAESHPQP